MNLAILSGVIVSDPTRHDFSNGGSVTRFRLKTQETYAIDGVSKESSQTHLIDIYNKALQDGVVKTLSRGQMIELTGSIRSRNTASEGQPPRWTTAIVIAYQGTLTVPGGSRSGMAVSQSATGDDVPEPRIDHSRGRSDQSGSDGNRDDGLDDDVPF